MILAEEAHLPLLEEALEILAATSESLPAVYRQGAEVEGLRTGAGPLDDVVDA